MSRFVCLMYHNVVARDSLGDPDCPTERLSPSITSYFVPDARLHDHLSAFNRSSWLNPTDLDQPASGSGDDLKALVTFDDGWAGTIDHAGPILESLWITGLMFVTTGLIGRPMFSTAAALRNVSPSVFEIGSHTVTHPFLSELDEAAIRSELVDSKHALEDVLSREVTSVSIPNGAIDDRVTRIAREAGYRHIFGSDVRINETSDRDSIIGRVAVKWDTPTETVHRWLDGKVHGANWRRNVLTLPKRVLGPARYRRLRAWALGERRGQDEMNSLMRGEATP
jgi:peptidoglycan/xylan/chitin deacetylase (PgdA/CDA1 family)